MNMGGADGQEAKSPDDLLNSNDNSNPKDLHELVDFKVLYQILDPENAARLFQESGIGQTAKKNSSKKAQELLAIYGEEPIHSMASELARVIMEYEVDLGEILGTLSSKASRNWSVLNFMFEQGDQVVTSDLLDYLEKLVNAQYNYKNTFLASLINYGLVSEVREPNKYGSTGKTVSGLAHENTALCMFLGMQDRPMSAEELYQPYLEYLDNVDDHEGEFGRKISPPNLDKFKTKLIHLAHYHKDYVESISGSYIILEEKFKNLVVKLGEVLSGENEYSKLSTEELAAFREYLKSAKKRRNAKEL